MRSLPQVSRGLSPMELGHSVAGENPETGIGDHGLGCLDTRLHGPHSWFTILFHIGVNEHLIGHPILNSVFIQIILWVFFLHSVYKFQEWETKETGVKPQIFSGQPKCFGFPWVEG